jgi:hypothetical protein
VVRRNVLAFVVMAVSLETYYIKRYARKIFSIKIFLFRNVGEMFAGEEGLPRRAGGRKM